MVWLDYGNNSELRHGHHTSKQSPGSPSSEFPTTNLTNFDLGEEKFKTLGDQNLAYCLNRI